MKTKLLAAVFLYSFFIMSCSRDGEVHPDYEETIGFTLNLAYLDNSNNDLLSNIYYGDRNIVTTIHRVNAQVNDKTAHTELYVHNDFHQKFINDDSIINDVSFTSAFNNLRAYAESYVDSAGVAKLSISFPTLFGTRVDSIECYYRVLYYGLSDSSLVDHDLSDAGFGSYYWIIDKILLNGYETFLRKVDRETGEITDEFTNKHYEGTLVINPLEP